MVHKQIITFYFDYLRLERFAKARDDVLFVGGAMTFLLNQLAGQIPIHHSTASVYSRLELLCA